MQAMMSDALSEDLRRFLQQWPGIRQWLNYHWFHTNKSL